ncbi:hypothetical protein BDR26DRAFT_863822 [Obelidium mucronatum]|nr:hypothetical protein BDR26DRAFT_863822 [Obelidium mucronatum]
MNSPTTPATQSLLSKAALFDWPQYEPISMMEVAFTNGSSCSSSTPTPLKDPETFLLEISDLFPGNGRLQRQQYAMKNEVQESGINNTAYINNTACPSKSLQLAFIKFRASLKLHRILTSKCGGRREQQRERGRKICKRRLEKLPTDDELIELEYWAALIAPVDRLALQAEHDRILKEMRESLR